jgi:hypothetical protein
MSAAGFADRVAEAQHRVEAGHGTPEDERLLALDRVLWGAAIAADAGCDAYGARVLPIVGGAS